MYKHLNNIIFILISFSVYSDANVDGEDTFIYNERWLD